MDKIIKAVVDKKLDDLPTIAVGTYLGNNQVEIRGLVITVRNGMGNRFHSIAYLDEGYPKSPRVSPMNDIVAYQEGEQVVVAFEDKRMGQGIIIGVIQ